MKDNSFALGVDIGGSHITAALVDLKSKTLFENSLMRSKVDSQGNAEDIISAWTDTISSVIKNVGNGVKHIGIAVPGPFDYEHGISLIKDQDKFRSLYSRNIKAELFQRLDLPEKNICFINDAVGFLQGEIFTGAAGVEQNVLGLTLGTGLGSALYLGEQAFDADLWHTPLFLGIAEDYLSTGWFIGRYGELTGTAVDGVREIAGR
jgi:glucokinase